MDEQRKSKWKKHNAKKYFTYKKLFGNYTENVLQSALIHGRTCTWIKFFKHTCDLYDKAFAVFIGAGRVRKLVFRAGLGALGFTVYSCVGSRFTLWGSEMVQRLGIKGS
jgi:hypothetical protein